MEGNVVSSSLLGKFSSSLEEAEADLSSRYSQILLRFRSIQTSIEAKIITHNSATMVDLLYEVMEALSYLARKAAENFQLISVVKLQNNMRGRLDKIDKNLRDIPETDQYQYQYHYHHNRVRVRVIHPDPSLITGFESQVLEIEKLMDSSTDGFKSIGIVGICGSGKTALAQKVFSSPNVEKKFFPRIWVSLSKRLLDDDMKETTLSHILTEMGHDASDLEYSDYSVVKLLEKLRRRLVGKRYLIVLDDAWRMADRWFADLGQPSADSSTFTHGLPKGSGGAVIVTSRGENVVRRMVGETHVIRPHLTQDICWAIFSDAVRQQGKIDPRHPTLNQMKQSIIKNCQGLPLAAKTLAYVISNLLAEKA